MTHDEIRAVAGEWCDVLYDDHGTHRGPRVMMPRESGNYTFGMLGMGPLWRFTDRDTGIDWFFEPAVVLECTPLTKRD